MTDTDETLLSDKLRTIATSRPNHPSWRRLIEAADALDAAQAEIEHLRAPAGDAMEAIAAIEERVRVRSGASSCVLIEPWRSEMIAALTAAKERSRQAGWRCFHCGEYFDTKEAALEHFGPNEMSEAGCQIDIVKYREMETLNWRHLAEDSDADRRYYKQQAKHAIALREEEEKGYTRGLRDGNYQAGIREGIEMAAQVVNAARGEGPVDLRTLVHRIRALLPAAPKEG